MSRFSVFGIVVERNSCMMCLCRTSYAHFVFLKVKEARCSCRLDLFSERRDDFQVEDDCGVSSYVFT